MRVGTRFTRVTVVGDGRQVDVSLPADARLGTQMPSLLRLLSVAPAHRPVAWRLAGPEYGVLSPGRCLDEYGVLDGATLHLTDGATGPAPPFLDDTDGAAEDDVQDGIARAVAEIAPSWSGAARRCGAAVLAAGLLLGWIAVGLGSAGPARLWAPAVALLVALRLAATPGAGGWVAGATAVPAAAALAVGLGARLPAAGPVVVAAAGALAAVAAIRRSPPALAGAAVVAVQAVAALVADRAGMPPERTAGITLLAAVLSVGLAGQLAVGGAGVLPLLVADESGAPVLRRSVRSAVRRGLGVATGVLWAAAATGGVAVWQLVARGSGGWAAMAGVVGGAACGLRCRMFSRARHVLPALAVAAVTAAAVAVALPRWFPGSPLGPAGSTLAGLAVATAVVVAAGAPRLSDVGRARWAWLCDRLEVAALVAFVPALVLLFRVVPAVQGWWR
ncbi:EsaB/YukD family protein [Nakamurella endophytica]|uniref:FAD-binding PCMH-type domain-containing protein n=1 Tax=Nakamurella endophytica TaxID=1748367 RepID=A0A917ST56_9ACTN|nr:EsaB/YukD family protein [Nakamurella endophytica]GGL96232.1 hypothetical protein GCM10011594_14950 [Nakamurella endophytica]